MAAAPYLRTITRRTRNSAPVLAPPRILMRGWEGGFPAEFASDADMTMRADPPPARETGLQAAPESPATANAPPPAVPVGLATTLSSDARVSHVGSLAAATPPTPGFTSPSDQPHLGEVEAATPAEPRAPVETTTRPIPDGDMRIVPPHRPAPPVTPEPPSAAASPPTRTPAPMPPEPAGPVREAWSGPPPTPGGPPPTPEPSRLESAKIAREAHNASRPFDLQATPDARPPPDRKVPAAAPPPRPRVPHALASYGELDPLRPVTGAAAAPNTRPPRPRSDAPELSSIAPASVAPALRAAFDWVLQPSFNIRRDPRRGDGVEPVQAAPQSALPDVAVPSAEPTARAALPPAASPEPSASPALWPPSPPPSALRSGPPTALAHELDPPRAIHIGSIEVRIETPPAFPPASAPVQAPPAPANPIGGLARGFTTPLGLRQG